MNKLEIEIEKYFSDHPLALPLFQMLKEVGEIYVMGGLLREYRDNHRILELRDADFSIHVKDRDTWNAIINNIPNRKNRFGGYKFECQGLIIDIWDIEDTWALKSNLINIRNDNFLDMLPNSVFLNMDALVYDITNDRWEDNIYNNAIRTNVLDVVLEKNPYIELNILRAMILRKKYNMTYSERLKEIMRNCLLENSDFLNLLLQIQKERYTNIMMSREEIQFELDSLY